MNEVKVFKGKAIYNPSGKAAEYSKWAVNFYNGCTGRCTYCYNRHGITASILGGDIPTLKKCLKDEATAIKIFMAETLLNLSELQKHGLLFNFVSDPYLPETWELNAMAIGYCLSKEVPVKVLTKQAWWVDDFLLKHKSDEVMWDMLNVWHIASFGFTLTGHDELEPGAASNEDRIRALKVLNEEGFKTWASIEPIIDIYSSTKMIDQICNHVDLIKVGIKSGAKYSSHELKSFLFFIENISKTYQFKVYLKDSLVSMAGIDRETLPENFVNRDFNLFS